MATANAQAAANTATARETAELNRINQRTPYGNLNYAAPNNAGWNEEAYLRANPDVQAAGMNGLDHYRQFGISEGRQGAEGYNPTAQWTVETTLSPEQRRLYETTTQGQQLYGDAAVSQLRGVQERLSTPFQFNGPEMTGSVQDRAGELQRDLDYSRYGDPNITRDRVEQGLFERMNPSLTQNRLGAENRLRNQGLTPGSEAWNNAIRDINQSENDARLAVIAQAGQEQSRLQQLALADAGFRNQAVGQAANMDLARGSFGNQARQQALQEQLALRSQPLNEAASLLTGQMVQNPQFTNVPQVQVAPTDYLGAVGLQQQAQQNAFNAKNQAYTANIQGMYGLGGQVLGAGTRWALGGVKP